MTPDEWRRHVKRILLLRSGYQFGQPDATTTLVTRDTPGDVACADTGMQLITRIVTGRRIRLNQVRRVSGAPHHAPTPTALVEPALRRLGLPYEQRLGGTARQVWDLCAARGPILLAEGYWSHPRWKGKAPAWSRDPRSGSRVRVGYARPSARAGNTQPDFIAGHMVVVAWAGLRDGERVFGVRDPNHASPARPERPAWDELSMSQMLRMLRSFTPSRTAICWAPTEVLFR